MGDADRREHRRSEGNHLIALLTKNGRLKFPSAARCQKVSGGEPNLSAASSVLGRSQSLLGKLGAAVCQFRRRRT